MIRSHQPPLYVTSLPGSGYDGQEVFLSYLTGQVEHYRYSAANTRWEIVAPGAPGCRVYRATDQTGIATGTWTNVSFSSERYDPNNMWGPGAATVVSIVKTGIYTISGNLKWDTNTTGSRYAYLAGSTAGTLALTHIVRASSESQMISTTAKLTAGEVVTLAVFQDSGANRSLISGAPFQELAVQYIPAAL